MIVVDVGCARYGGDYSIERLVTMFYPDELYGFDPSWEEDWNVQQHLLHPTSVYVEKKAAWIYDGEVHFFYDGLNSKIGTYEHWPLVPCFDLAKFIYDLPQKKIILKIDAEGAEYELLKRLILTDADKRLSLAIVEWHCLGCGRGAGRHREDCPGEGDSITRRLTLEEELACPLQEWQW